MMSFTIRNYNVLKSFFYIISIALFAGSLAACGSRKVLTDASDMRNRKITSRNVKKRYSVLLDVPERKIKNEKLYHFIDKWMGTPHVDGGMAKNGVDCSGFTFLLEKEIYNKTLPRVASQMAAQVKRKYENQLKEGDLVFFNFGGRAFSHVGVYLQNNKFVHVSTRKGVIVSNLKDPWYYKYFSRAGSIEN